MKGHVGRDVGGDPECPCRHKRIPHEIAAELAEHAADDELDFARNDGLRLIAAGNANKQIADKLSIRKRPSRATSAAFSRSWAPTIGPMPDHWTQRGIIELGIPHKYGS